MLLIYFKQLSIIFIRSDSTGRQITSSVMPKIEKADQYRKQTTRFEKQMEELLSFQN
jgi:hypothetical protein